MTSRALRMKNECGEDIPVDYDDGPAVERAIDEAIRMARDYLPSGTVYEIRGKTRPDDRIHREPLQRRRRSREDLAKNWGVAWYWTSADINGYYGGLKQEPLFRHALSSAEDAPFGGYIIIARLRVQ